MGGKMNIIQSQNVRRRLDEKGRKKTRLYALPQM